MADGFQVVKFVMVDFDKGWKRALLPNAVFEYTAVANGANLAVVFEGATGVFTTYRYQLAEKDVVYVNGQVIHIAAHCSRQEPGNTIKCG
jgi:hypothetical protein